MKSIPLANYDNFDRQDVVKDLTGLAAEYADLHWKEYMDSIVEFPVEEGYAPTAKRDMVFTVTRAFLEWCALREEKPPQDGRRGRPDRK